MAADQITYPTKEQGQVNPAPEAQKLTFGNANEIKDVVNSHADLLDKFPSIQFDTTLGIPSHSEALMFWDDVNKTIALFVDETDSTLQIGQEIWFRATNNTGSTITNGSVVYISGESGGIPTIALADASQAATALSTIAVATHDIEDATIGISTVIGTVRGINTSSFSAGDILFLSTSPGVFTNTAPSSPNYNIQIGTVSLVNAVTGTVEVSISKGSNIGDVLKIFNGATLEQTTVTTTSNGTVVTQTFEKSGGGDVNLFFDGLFSLFDATPTASVALTPGSDADPTLNYTYIPKSTMTLTVSTVGFPTNEQYVPVAITFVQSAATLQTDDCIMCFSWTDHLSDGVDQGHLSHLNRWVRSQHATHLSGMATATTPIVGGGTAVTTDVSISSGLALQLHEHASPSYDTSTGSDVYVINHPVTAYTIVNDLDILIDADNNSLSNTRYNLVLWQAVAETTSESKLFMNLPSGSYGTNENAINDVDRTANLTVPSGFTGTAILIARITIRHRTAAGGSFEILNIEDLTGIKPSSSGGGGGTGAVKNEFSDNVFRVFDDGDNTKKIAFEASSIATATTRTVTFPDKDLTLIEEAPIDGNTYGRKDGAWIVLP